MISCLGFLLAKAVGACDQRENGYPCCILGRQQPGVKQKQARHNDIVGVIDDVFEAIAVKPRNNFVDSCGAREGAVGGVDGNGKGHQPEGSLKISLLDLKNGCESNHGSDGRVEMNEPGEDDAAVIH